MIVLTVLPLYPEWMDYARYMLTMQLIFVPLLWWLLLRSRRFRAWLLRG